MTDLIDIARSGLLAYRGALAATAENVANAATEGYVRRDVTIVPLGGAQATPATAPTGGQGALLTEVRRAFDALAAGRLRETAGGQAAAEAHLNAAQAIEALMLPGDDGIDATLRGFFDALADLSGGPTDLTARSRVLQAGAELAGAVSALAGGLADLRDDLAAQASIAADRAGGLLQDLASLSRRMSGLGGPVGAQTGAVHGLADQRDVLLDALARILPVSVDLDAQGRPTVRLGHAEGPLLLQGDRSARITATAADLLTMTVDTADGSRVTTRAIAGGELGGLSRGLGALDMAAQELDGFARTLAATANAVHRRGVDLNGHPGGDLFRLAGWEAVPALANGGTVRLDLATTDVTGSRAVTLVYDGAAALWRARDVLGAEIATGTDTLDLPGLTVQLSGSPADGDRVTLTPAAGRAVDLAWLPDSPAALAAAGAFATAASPHNLGTAAVSVRMATAPTGGPAAVASVVGTGTADLLGGVVGLVPAGTGSLALQGWGRSAATVAAYPAGATELTLAVDTVTAEFDLSALAEGTLRSSDGQSLAQLGLTVTARPDGSLEFTRPGTQAPAAVTINSAGGPVTGTATPGATADGTLQVFTRNGRHVAGTPLTAAEAAALITPENGFLPGAVYDPRPLQPGDAAGYRGLAQSRAVTQGLQSVELAAGGTATGAGLPLPAAAARSLSLSDAAGAATTVTLAAGATAAMIAEALDGAVPGLSARAETALQLSDLPAGTVSFDLQGANGAPLRVTATQGAGDAAPLAQAVNALSSQTGIRAELSPDSGRILLVQEAGHDITLSSLTVPMGGSLRATPAAADGAALGAAVDLAAGAALRQGGQVALVAAQGFSVADGATVLVAQPGGPGPVGIATSRAGAQVRLDFADVAPGADGAMAFAVTASGQTATLAVPPGTPAATVAAAMAASLRAGGATAELTGAPLAMVPPDGTALALTADGVSYMLRIEGGVPVVTGPEPGRLTASFDGTNRLVIRAEGMTDGRGIGIATSAALGFGAGQGVQVLTGRPPLAADLPATVEVTVGGTQHQVDLAAGSATASPGFPGTLSVDPGTGALSMAFAVPGDAVVIGPAPDAGFGGPGAAVRVDGGSVVLAGDGAALGVRVTAEGALGEALVLDGLPPEDLIVAMTGTGTLRMSAQTGAMTPPDDPGGVEIVVTDAATGAVALRDAASGHTIAEGVLDAQGAVTLGGVALRLTGTPATGDRFSVIPAAAGSADAAIARELAALRNGDAATGTPGMTDRLARLQSDAGVRVAAAGRANATAAAAAEAAERRMAAIGAVDLDTEAARLVELQQAYQASAQAIAVARSLFDTLLGMF